MMIQPTAIAAQTTLCRSASAASRASCASPKTGPFYVVAHVVIHTRLVAETGWTSRGADSE